MKYSDCSPLSGLIFFGPASVFLDRQEPQADFFMTFLNNFLFYWHAQSLETSVMYSSFFLLHN